MADFLGVDIDILKNMPEDNEGFNIVFEYNHRFNSAIAENQHNNFSSGIDMDLVNRLIESEKGWPCWRLN